MVLSRVLKQRFEKDNPVRPLSDPGTSVIFLA